MSHAVHASALDPGTLLELRRWNTPTIYNGLEQYTKADRRTLVNLEDVTDFAPHMGAMVGYAVTLVLQPGEPSHVSAIPDAWDLYRRYIAMTPGPKIVICQDLDKPRCFGAGWGEVNANFHRTAGCVGAIVDGAVRDIDDVAACGFKLLARRLAVSHCYATPVRWDCEVDVFGIKVKPGQLIHADKHGFVAVPPGEEKELLTAARFMDTNECNTMIAAARAGIGQQIESWLPKFEASVAKFGRIAASRFQSPTGETL